MLSRAALSFANHVLTGQQWARARLQPFAGQTANLELGAITIPIAITRDGLLASGSKEAGVAVAITFPDDAPLRALLDRPSLLSSARVAGSAELAETLNFVFRNLRWDIEDDVSRLIGDVAAHRLLEGGRQIVQWHLRRAKNLARNVSEYLTEESPTIAKQADITKFCTAVDATRDDCARLERRLLGLEGRRSRRIQKE